jgi:hypothetical protein
VGGPLGAIAGAILGYFGGEKAGEIIGAKAGEAFNGFRGSELQAHILETWDTSLKVLDTAWQGLSDALAPIVNKIKENADIANKYIKEKTGIDVSAEVSSGYEKAKTWMTTPLWGSKSDGDVGAKKDIAMKYFSDQGWSPEATSGIVSNLLQESNLNEKAAGDSGHAVGIAQWQEPRQAEFEKKFGKSVKDASFEEQLEFVHHELTAGNDIGAKIAGAKLKQPISSSDAGSVFSKLYERPMDKDGEASRRGVLAQNIFMNHGKAAESFSPTKPSISVVVPSPSLPVTFKATKIEAAPVISERLAGTDRPISVNVMNPIPDVARDVSDRGIAHLVTGGLSGN